MRIKQPSFFKIFFLKFFVVLMLTFVSQTAQSQCCDYNLVMQDSYGDGWNGGYLEVSINNSIIGNYSASNYGSNATFQVCNGDSVSLIYHAGSYENENTFQLYNQNWNHLFSNGPTPTIGQIFDTVANCSSPQILGNHPCTALSIDTSQCFFTDNTSMTGSGINAGCANMIGGDIWFKMIVPPSGNLLLETDSGTINDTGLGAWVSDSSCTNLQFVGCDDDAGNGYYSLLQLNDLTPGKTLYIQAFGYNGAVGTFKICATDLGKMRLDSTELPLIMINTLGQQINGNSKINAMMDIKYNGYGNITHITDSSNIYSGNIGIEIRGATSSGYPQKPYAIETRTSTGSNNNVSILGMPAENDWVLLSNYNDRSLIRNTLAYKLFAEMGNYSVRTSLCEVLIDSAYKGIYVFGEKIKRDNNRVNIAKLTSSENTSDALTGGYILEQNLWNANNSFQSNYSPIDHPGFDVHYLYKEPSADSITVNQKSYIASFIDSLEDALYSPNFVDTTLGYRKYLDTKSFIDYFLMNELTRNNDGFKKSVIFHKDKFSKGGKLKAGPIWDFDWAWKNMYGCSMFENTNGSGWAHHINDCPTDNYSNGYYIRLLQDTTFSNELYCAYKSYRETILDTIHIFAYIDSIRNVVQNAQARHFQKWHLLGVSGDAPELGPFATTYNAELDTLKNWIKIRLKWLDENMPGHCYPIDISNVNDITKSAFKYYPNPSKGTIHFEGIVFNNENAKLKIYDVTGNLVIEKTLTSGKQNFDCFIDNSGAYYFVITNNGKTQTGKIIVIK